jgi:hypothetical protein
MDIVFMRGKEVVRVFCNVPESYTLDDLRRDMHVIGSPLTAHVTESAGALLCDRGKAPTTAAPADAAEARADVQVSVSGR